MFDIVTCYTYQAYPNNGIIKVLNSASCLALVHRVLKEIYHAKFQSFHRWKIIFISSFSLFLDLFLSMSCSIKNYVCKWNKLRDMTNKGIFYSLIHISLIPRAEFGRSMWLFRWKIFNFCVRELFSSSRKSASFTWRSFCREVFFYTVRRIKKETSGDFSHTLEGINAKRKLVSKENRNKEGNSTISSLISRRKKKSFSQIYESFQKKKLFEEFSLKI